MKKTARLLPLALLLTALPCAAQGPLSPPGAPAPTMKTLEEIHDRTDPRTPISSLPYPITEPGSYYVVSNLHSTGHGIVIETNGVTVDLMGFSLTGDGGDYGIHVDGATNALIDKVVIKNGTVTGFYRGLYCEYMNNSRIEQVVVSGNANVGVYLNGASSGQCDGNTIANCTISGNTSYGVHLRGDNSGQCDGNTIANCTISGNTSYGVYLRAHSGQCNGNTIADCTISDNSRGVSLSGYQGQCDGNTIAACTISGNTSYGVYLRGDSGQCNGNTIQENRISKNANRGIYLWYADGNRVEANHISGMSGATSYGIWTDTTTGNFILKNTCVGQTSNFVMSASATYGPEVTSSGSLPTFGAAAHPWANFSR